MVNFTDIDTYTHIYIYKYKYNETDMDLSKNVKEIIYRDYYIHFMRRMFICDNGDAFHVHKILNLPL